MKIHESRLDAYSSNILNKIPEDIQITFTSEQKEAIYGAIRRGIIPKEHTVDVRGEIPFFFKKYYFVFHFGRDTRKATLMSEDGRRRKARRLANISFFIFARSPLILILFLVLYYIKSALGINMFNNFHLTDVSDYLFSALDNWIEGNK